MAAVVMAQLCVSRLATTTVGADLSASFPACQKLANEFAPTKAPATGIEHAFRKQLKTRTSETLVALILNKPTFIQSVCSNHSSEDLTRRISFQAGKFKKMTPFLLRGERFKALSCFSAAWHLAMY